MPFDVIPLFYTNLVRDPEPSREGFGAIFRRVCKEHGLQADESVVDYLLARWYERLGAHLKGCYPRNLVEAVPKATRYAFSLANPSAIRIGDRLRVP